MTKENSSIGKVDQDEYILSVSMLGYDRIDIEKVIVDGKKKL